MSNIIRNVPASDETRSPKPWDLTHAQWSVYYWLLAHSNWNSAAKEDHYYIYKNSFTQRRIMGDLGIKSAKTITTAFHRLEEVGAVVPSLTSEGAYEIKTISLYAPMDVSIIRFLLGFNRYLDPAILVTTFAIMVRSVQLADTSIVCFTKTEFAALLGIVKTHTEDCGILMAFAILEFAGLIKLDKQVYTNRLGVECIRYKILEVNPKLNVSAYLNADEEADPVSIAKLWNSLH